MLTNTKPAYDVVNTNQSLARRAVSVFNVAHTMRMLAETTYSKPIDAVVRETVANAIDASRGKQFKIGIPSLLDPNFRVQDWGVGMTEQFFLEDFSALGRSTKNQSNDEIGGFGQGRFAPFAYAGCDCFYVRAVKDGKWFLGSIERNANFEVFVDVQNRGVTDEDDGTEIIVPVLTKDHPEFKRAVETYTEFLAPPPICSVSPRKAKVELVGDGWRVTGIGYASDRTVNVVMGGIPYDLSIDEVYGHYSWPLWDIRAFTLFFKIGELAVSNSRETLRYDDATRAAIKQRISQMKQEISDRCAKREASFAREWDKLNDKELRLLYRAMDKTLSKTIRVHSYPSMMLAHSLSHALNHSGVSQRKKDFTVSATNGALIYLLDDHKGWRRKFRHHLDSVAVEGNPTIVILGNDLDITAMDNPPYTKISTLPEPPKLVRQPSVAGPRVVNPTPMFEANGGGGWNEIPATLEGPKVWLPMVVTKLTDEFQILVDIQAPQKGVIGVPKALWKHVENDSAWVRWDDHIRQSLTPAMQQAYTVYKTMDYYNMEYSDLRALAKKGFDPDPAKWPTANILFNNMRLMDSHNHRAYQLLEKLGYPPVGDLQFNSGHQLAQFEQLHPILHRAMRFSHVFDASQRSVQTHNDILDIAHRLL